MTAPYWPRQEAIEHALRVLDELVVDSYGHHPARSRRALRVLQAAARPRPVLLAKEVAEALGVHPSNLNSVRGLPTPAWRLARPHPGKPDRTVRVWYADEISAFAAGRRAEREDVSE